MNCKRLVGLLFAYFRSDGTTRLLLELFLIFIKFQFSKEAIFEPELSSKQCSNYHFPHFSEGFRIFTITDDRLLCISDNIKTKNKLLERCDRKDRNPNFVDMPASFRDNPSMLLNKVIVGTIGNQIEVFVLALMNENKYNLKRRSKKPAQWIDYFHNFYLLPKGLQYSGLRLYNQNFTHLFGVFLSPLQTQPVLFDDTLFFRVTHWWSNYAVKVLRDGFKPVVLTVDRFIRNEKYENFLQRYEPPVISKESGYRWHATRSSQCFYETDEFVDYYYERVSNLPNISSYRSYFGRRTTADNQTLPFLFPKGTKIFVGVNGIVIAYMITYKLNNLDELYDEISYTFHGQMKNDSQVEIAEANKSVIAVLSNKTAIYVKLWDPQISPEHPVEILDFNDARILPLYGRIGRGIHFTVQHHTPFLYIYKEADLTYRVNLSDVISGNSKVNVTIPDENIMDSYPRQCDLLHKICRYYGNRAPLHQRKNRTIVRTFHGVEINAYNQWTQQVETNELRTSFKLDSLMMVEEDDLLTLRTTRWTISFSDLHVQFHACNCGKNTSEARSETSKVSIEIRKQLCYEIVRILYDQSRDLLVYIGRIPVESETYVISSKGKTADFEEIMTVIEQQPAAVFSDVWHDGFILLKEFKYSKGNYKAYEYQFQKGDVLHEIELDRVQFFGVYMGSFNVAPINSGQGKKDEEGMIVDPRWQLTPLIEELNFINPEKFEYSYQRSLTGCGITHSERPYFKAFVMMVGFDIYLTSLLLALILLHRIVVIPYLRRDTIRQCIRIIRIRRRIKALRLERFKKRLAKLDNEVRIRYLAKRRKILAEKRKKKLERAAQLKAARRKTRNNEEEEVEKEDIPSLSDMESEGEAEEGASLDISRFEEEEKEKAEKQKETEKQNEHSTKPEEIRKEGKEESSSKPKYEAPVPQSKDEGSVTTERTTKVDVTQPDESEAHAASHVEREVGVSPVVSGGIRTMITKSETERR
ncbi:hypothetical protein AB6A40_002823 [Gnathostoma spinigerum]|uniref:Uncharacterized protein n=1 Tax=Gnathostoma spinigerum TaxID=75299 RepID=A0ABD6EFI8_9BILA